MKNAPSFSTLSVFLVAGFGAFAAEPVISADRADCLYATGERVVFTVRGDASLGSVNIWIDDGGTSVVARTVCDFAATNACELSAKRDTPGALRLRVSGPKCKEEKEGEGGRRRVRPQWWSSSGGGEGGSDPNGGVAVVE